MALFIRQTLSYVWAVQPQFTDWTDAFNAVSTLALKDHLPNELQTRNPREFGPPPNWSSLPPVTLVQLKGMLNLSRRLQHAASDPLLWARELAAKYETTASLATICVGDDRSPST